MNWNGFGTKQLWLNQVLSQHLPGETEENYENLSQDSQSQEEDLKLGLPEYEHFKSVLEETILIFADHSDHAV
jgi:hypothetical protein